MAASPLGSQSQPSPKALAFIHVTVIDATGAPARQEMTVVIVGDRVSELGKFGAVRIPNDARVIDAKGKFLIPGLWDMHAHWQVKEYLPLYLANGVTGLRIMFGFPVHHEARKELENGTLLGPRLVIGSPLVDGPNPIHRGSIAVSNESEGRQAVTKVKQEDYDFVKVYSLLPRDAYFAIANEAKKQGIPFAGHVPRSVTATEASDAGQRSIEHLSGVAFACSNLEAELSADLAKLRADVAAGGNYLFLLRRLELKHLNAYNKQKAKALFARFKKNETWHTPTLDVIEGGVALADPHFKDPRLKYLPAQVREQDPRQSRVYQNFTAADYDGLKRILLKQLQIVREMQRAGVQLLSGTDVPALGFSLHDELRLMVKAGLTPMEALQTATRNPAKYLGLLDSLGTVERGKTADLVLLEANPLENIGNTQKISAVVVRGRLLERTRLDQMLSDVEAVSNRKP